jgi:hypothetical protein
LRPKQWISSELPILRAMAQKVSAICGCLTRARQNEPSGVAALLYLNSRHNARRQPRGGTRLKIYEAMATAKAVVSTSVGAEGLDVHHGRDIMLADDSRSFAQAVIMLLRDSELRRRYEQAAAETAARYDWPAIGERFSEVLRSVAEKRTQAVRASDYRKRVQAGWLDVFFQQTPDASGHGLAAHEVVIHELANTSSVKIAAIEGAGFEQDHQHVFQFVSHPVDQREGEALLLAIKHFPRHADALGQFSKIYFCWLPRSSYSGGRPATHSTNS